MLMISTTHRKWASTWLNSGHHIYPNPNNYCFLLFSVHAGPCHTNPFPVAKALSLSLQTGFCLTENKLKKNKQKQNKQTKEVIRVPSLVAADPPPFFFFFFFGGGGRRITLVVRRVCVCVCVNFFLTVSPQFTACPIRQTGCYISSSKVFFLIL